MTNCSNVRVWLPMWIIGSIAAVFVGTAAIAQQATDSREGNAPPRRSALSPADEPELPAPSEDATEAVGASEPDQPARAAESSDVWQSSALANHDVDDTAVSEPLRFNFSSASWRDVLEWFAGAARMNLNWREMPEGELNLITRGSYNVAEAHDVLNMHLLARGFTLLQRDGALLLVKLDESLNPTMVPRVQPEELDKRGNYEFVKVSLPLDWMLAEEAAKELAPILSPYGKIVPLTATNRIEAMDAVSNLRELRNLLQREQSDNSQERLVAEFQLEHANALEVIEKLNQLLGLEKAPERMSRDQMRMAREQMMLRTEIVKRLGEQAPRFEPKGADVHLVANERQNSILANAPPDKMAIIRQAVAALDVPPAEDGIRLSEVTTMKVYPLNGAEADAVASILEELRAIGKLHPSARFSEDDDRQILFAYASLQDHLTISSVMDQLAGSARNFHVIPLRQLKAAYVADSIRTLMQGAGESQNSDRRDRWRRRRRESDDNNNSWSGFRVEADPPNNRLFLFATTAEFEQVEELLIKLGERAGLAANQRIISVADESLDETIERVRSLWPTLSVHPLRIDVPGHEPEAGDSSQNDAPQRSSWRSDKAARRSTRDERNADDNESESDSTEPPKDAAAAAAGREAIDRQALAYNPTASTRKLYSVADLGEQSPAIRRFEEPAELGPRPVYIRKGSNGELILSSEDREALDQLEGLFWSSLPQTKPYAVFRLKHVSPYSIQLTLQDVFASDGVRATTPLKFVSDSLTKSIMVFGAGPSELQEIEELIEFYDQSTPVDPETTREPRFIELQYASADVVANVIKDLYRDLLSPNDRAVAQPRGERSRDQVAFVSSSTADVKQPQFKGMLSIGTFSATNTLIVSAPQYLADEIERTVRELDRDEAGTVTSVVQIDGRVNGALIAERLMNAMSPTPTRSAQTARQGRSEQPQVRSPSNERQTQTRNDRAENRRSGRRNGQRAEPNRPARTSGNGR